MDTTGDPTAGGSAAGRPASYAWEATDEAIAERYGLPIERVVRFDLNTSPAPPRLLGEVLAAGVFAPPLSEYPPGDYRLLVQAAADRYGVATDEIVPGAGADEILDLCAKAFLAAGDVAVVPEPTYAMYRVVTEQRGGVVVPVPRLGPADGFGLDLLAMRAAAHGAALVWLCDPNSPTGGLEAQGTIDALVTAVREDAAADGREPAVVVVDEAYAEFAGSSAIPLRRRHPNLVIVRTTSKAYALAGLRVGFAIAERPLVDRIALYRPPGSIGTISATVAARALREDGEMLANVARVAGERDRFRGGLAAADWTPYPSVTNFVLVSVGTPVRAAAAAERLRRRGLVPRTFGAGHPLAHCLRITIRDPLENEMLLAAIREPAVEGAA